MPELIEAELYRTTAADTIGRRIEAVDVPVPEFVRGGTVAELRSAMVGRPVIAARRIGKVVLVDLGDAAGGSCPVTVGLRFGMTGRLLVDGDAAIDRLEYSSGRDDPAWDRLLVSFDDGGDLRVRDQRRLGSVELSPDEGAFGADAASINADELALILGGSGAALKSRLMDQARVAGLGNLLTDETLWRAGMSPKRPSSGLDGNEVATLAATIVETIADLTSRGGSHRGDLQDERKADGRCPVDEAPLSRATVGGRTTYWCPAHQH